MTLTAGLGGVTSHGCVALGEPSRLVAVCEQERVTRVRNAGFNATGLPDEALDLLLHRLGRARGDIGRYVLAEADHGRPAPHVERIEHHLAHAAASYLPSPFSSAAIVVCDDEAPGVSVWQGRAADMQRVDWRWDGTGFAGLYAACARVLGFTSEAGLQRFEALARLRPYERDDRIERLFALDDTSLRVEPGWERTIETLCAGEARTASAPPKAAIASALQGRIADLFVEFLTRVRDAVETEHLCLAGSLFYHSSINARVKSAAVFSEVFVPVNPGNAGLAVGTALHANGHAPSRLSAFLGPRYEPHEIKQTLDNCKLQYAWESDEDAIGIAVKALMNGTLVAWFEGEMEWGARALGGRSILANPFAPFVLENLNGYLKHREPWRGYAVSGLEAAVRRHFDGPASAPFMECDYRPLDKEAFRHVMPAPGAAIRIQTVGRESPPRFRRLLEAFGAATGLPFLVNTSFNGFHEPIVCTPRDAVRVFYGTGLDVLMLEHFVLRK